MSPKVKSDLLFCARLLEQTLAFYIRKDLRDGDEEAASMKTATLNLVRQAIANAETEAEIETLSA